MKKLFFMMLAVCTLASCSKDGVGEGNSNITVPDQSQLTQTAYADNMSGQSGVTFTTTGAWTSSISESTPTKAGTPDWVTISPASGSAAGSYTINITLGNNYTGSKRTATITINCGGEEITISITQEGKTEAGVVPVRKLIDRIVLEGINADNSPSKNLIAFTYDNQDRVVKFRGTDPGDEIYFLNYDITYGINSVEIKGTQTIGKDILDGGGNYTVRMTQNVDLDANGRAVKSTITHQEGYYNDHLDGPDVTIFEYQNGFLSKSTESSVSWMNMMNSNEPLVEKLEKEYRTSKYIFNYLGGDVASLGVDLLFKYDNAGDIHYSWKETYECGTTPNTANLDLNFLTSLNVGSIAPATSFILPVLNIMGKRSSNLFSKISENRAPISPNCSSIFTYKMNSEGDVIEIKELRTEVYSETEGATTDHVTNTWTISYK